MIKRLLRILLVLLLLPVAYALLALLLGMVPLNRSGITGGEHNIHLTTNGVHLQLILTREDLSPDLLTGLPLRPDTRHVGFGWGDADFYLNTPEWADLTVKRAVVAAFLPSRTLVHVQRHRATATDWVAVPVDDDQLAALNAFLLESCERDEAGAKVLLPEAGYTAHDDFLRGTGRYTALRTCNTWVNDGLRRASLPASLWTPFDFAVLRWYR